MAVHCRLVVMSEFLRVKFAVDSGKVVQALLSAVKADDSPLRFPTFVYLTLQVNSCDRLLQPMS